MSTFIISCIILLLVVLAIRSLWKDRKSGKGCGGACSHCSGGCAGGGCSSDGCSGCQH